MLEPLAQINSKANNFIVISDISSFMDLCQCFICFIFIYMLVFEVNYFMYLKNLKCIYFFHVIQLQLFKRTNMLPSQGQLHSQQVSPQPTNKRNLFKQKTVLDEGRAAIDALKILHDVNDKKDIAELSKILGDYLKFPSTSSADLHSYSNRLGVSDIKDLQMMEETAVKLAEKKINDNASELSSQQQGFKEGDIRFCKCCGLTLQSESISAKQDLMKVNHLGVSIYLYFFTIKNLGIMLFALLLLFSAYSISSNLMASNIYKSSLSNKKVDDKLNTFEGMISTSLGSKQVHQTQFGSNSFAVQCWLGVVIVFVWGILFAFIKYRERLHQQQIDVDSITPSDFTLVFEDMPKTMTKKQLQRQLRKYQSQVRHNYHLNYRPSDLHSNFETLLAYDISVEKINFTAPFYLNQEDFQDEQLEKVNNEVKEMQDKFRDWIKYRRSNYSFQVTYEQRLETYNKFEELKSKKKELYKKIIEELKAKKKRESTHLDQIDAFVTFKSNANKLLLQRLHQTQGNPLYLLPFSSHPGYFWYKTENNKYLCPAPITQSPEPEDVVWVNYGQSAMERIKTFIITFSVSIVVLCISFFMIAGLSKLDIMYNSAQDDQKSASAKKDMTKFILGKAATIGLIVVNALVPMILTKLTEMQRNISYTKDQTSIGLKSSFVVLLNIILLPIIIDKVFKDNVYGVDGLTSQIYSFSMTNAFVTPIMKLLNSSFILGRVKHFVFNLPVVKLYMKVSQKDLNKNSEFIEFEIGAQYVQIVTIYLFTCFFVSLQPIIAVFCLIQMFLFYWAQKIALYKICKRPIPGNNIINKAMYQLIYCGPLFYTLGSFCWTDFIGSQKSGRVANLVALVLSIFIIFVPYQVVVRQIQLRFGQQAKFQLAMFKQNRVFLSSQYDRLNPLTSEQAAKEYKQFLKTFMKNLQSKPPHEQVNILKKFEKQNGLGGYGKNIYEDFVDKDDADIVVENFVDNSSTNPYLTGKSIQMIKQMKFDWQQQVQKDRAIGLDSYKRKHITAILNEDLIVDHSSELTDFMERRREDPYLNDTPIEVKVGSFKNQTVIINIYDPNKVQDEYDFDEAFDNGEDDYYDKKGAQMKITSFNFAAASQLSNKSSERGDFFNNQGQNASNRSIGNEDFSNSDRSNNNDQDENDEKDEDQNENEENEDQNEDDNKDEDDDQNDEDEKDDDQNEDYDDDDGENDDNSDQ